MTLDVGGPCISMTGIFFADDRSAPSRRVQLEITDPNYGTSIWKSNKLFPGQQQNLEGVAIQGHTQVSLKFSCLGDDDYDNSCKVGIKSGMLVGP